MYESARHRWQHQQYLRFIRSCSEAILNYCPTNGVISLPKFSSDSFVKLAPHFCHSTVFHLPLHIKSNFNMATSRTRQANRAKKRKYGRTWAMVKFDDFGEELNQLDLVPTRVLPMFNKIKGFALSSKGSRSSRIKKFNAGGDKNLRKLARGFLKKEGHLWYESDWGIPTVATKEERHLR